MSQPGDITQCHQLPKGHQTKEGGGLHTLWTTHRTSIVHPAILRNPAEHT